MNRIVGKVLISITLLFAVSSAFAQEGANNAYSPYSVYGIGDLYMDGSAFNKTMGGIGVATRNNRYINLLNPASITARDSLSFMAEVGLYENNKVFTQMSGENKLKSANNTFNICSFAMTFPIWRSSAFIVGINPYSDVGYDFTTMEKQQDIIGVTNNITYQSYGAGGVYKIFFGAAATFWKRLSVGAQLDYYFGTIDKITNTVFSDNSHRSINAGYDMQVRAVGGKVGLQYEQRLASRVSMILGATYRPSIKMGGTLDDYSYAVTTELTDTLRNKSVSLKNAGLRLGNEVGVGVTIKGSDQWSAEFDYKWSDWRKSGFDSADAFKISTSAGHLFTAAASHSFRAGFEYTPNRSDTRYYHKKITYRGGLYHEQSYYMMDENKVSASGFTFGLTLPIPSERRTYNSITIGADFGQKGNLRSGMVRERYAAIMVSFNFHDYWFIKPQYK